MTYDEQELRELISALQNGTLSADEHKKLDQVLSGSEAARHIYYDCVDVDLQLTRRYASHDPMPSGMRQQVARKSRALTLSLGIATHFAAIAVTILVLALGWGYGDDQEAAGENEFAAAARSDYIATLARSVDCVWGESNRPRFDGQRLLTDELRLTSGLAEFSFDSGVRLVVEGPASLKIDSAKSAVLSYGKVVLRGSEAGEPFRLYTPTTLLVDIGTEYGIAVTPQGETEVHVFEGEVSVEPPAAAMSDSGAEVVLLTEGQASLFAAESKREIDFDAKGFVRQLPVGGDDEEFWQDVLAYEGFSYPPQVIGNADGGSGWLGGWRQYIREGSPSANQVVVDDAFGSGACLKAEGRGNVSWRTLSSPLRLDVDASYYLSFLVRKRTASPRGASQYCSVSLCSIDYPSDRSNLSFGMSSDANLSVNHNEQQILSAPPMPFDETVLIVAKVVAGKQAADQVMVRWYGPLEDVSLAEPHTWTSVSHSSFSDAAFSELSIRSGGDAAYLFDEIKISRSWAAAIDGVALASERK